MTEFGIIRDRGVSPLKSVTPIFDPSPTFCTSCGAEIDEDNERLLCEDCVARLEYLYHNEK